MLSKLLTMLRTALVCWIPLTAAAMAQSTINVGPGQAYTTIQSGINAAVNGDTVLVAANTNNAPYYENIDFKGKAIAVYAIANGGPFAIIDGGGGGPVVTFKSGEGRNSILSGFTIQNGGGVTNVFDTGGIYIAGSSPTISNNTITHNFCQGIYAYDSSPLIQGNEIDNTLDDGKHGCSFGGGAAIWLFGSLTSSGSSTPLPPVVIGNTLQNNTQSGVEDAGGNGGAGIAVWTTNAAIENNIIRNNLSHGQGAGIHLEDSGNLVVQNLIYNNEAGGGGGGLDVNGAYGPVTTFIANNTFANNTYGSGGGSSIDEAVAQIFFGPFTGSGNTIAFVNNIVAGSSTEPSVACGSPSYIDRGSNAIILDHNLFYNAVGPTFYLCPDPTGIYGNIKADPKFVNAASDFHLAAGSPAIDAGNNSVNAFLSTNTIAEPLTLTTDVEGNARLQDATGVGYPIIDMGAYEFAGSKDANATTLLLTASTYYSSAGVPFTLTTKAISGNGTVTGPITFVEDGITLGTVNLDGTGTAVQSTGLTPGLHRFLSTYPGQGVFTAATSIEAIVEVNLYSVGLTLTSSLNPSIVGQTVTFTVTLSSLDTNQLGPITLTDGFNNTVLATLTPNASGVATFSISTLALGNHYITATYAGDATHDSAYANVFQRVVSGYATNTTLMCAVNPITVGGTTLLTATVSSSNGVPTGSIAFADNGAALGTQSLSGGAASLTYTGLVVGTHTLTATYVPTGTYAASAGSCIEVVEGAPTTTVASVSPNPSTYGQPVVFSVHVAPVTANASVPSGQVVFTFCHGAQDTVTLDASGNGSFLYPPPGNANVVAEPVGSCAFTAEYMGDSKFESSTSTAVAYVVVPSPSTTAVVASPNPAYQGQVVTLTATITGVPSPTLNPVTGNPIPPAQTPGTGTVQFFDGSTLIGTAAVNGSNQAVLTTSSLAAGTHSITAVYSGDANLGGSGSGSYSEVILASTFTIALSPTTITLAAGQPGSVAVQLTSVGAFAGPLTLTYGALPMYATAKITPGTVTLAAGGTGSATFALNTVVKAESVAPVRPGSRAVPGVFAAVVLLMLPLVRGRRKRLARLMVMAAVVLQGMTGCTNVSYLLSTVAPGTYAVPITATDANGNAKSAVLTVVVTP